VPVIDDKEFGPITVRRSERSSSIRISTAPNGTLRISAPTYTPLFMVRRVIAGSRAELRSLLEKRPALTVQDGMDLGKSHHLLVRPGSPLGVSRRGQTVLLTLPDTFGLDDPAVVELMRRHIAATLRREAKQYLPRRLETLARQHGFDYAKVRFSHAGSRWGSCNHNRVISLNIGLMNLPFELIDYVLIHELAHTKELNHSKAFWALVKAADPAYEDRRRLLKSYSPAV
jgi:predicted metal-dependent hydrolase